MTDYNYDLIRLNPKKVKADFEKYIELVKYLQKTCDASTLETLIDQYLLDETRKTSYNDDYPNESEALVEFIKNGLGNLSYIMDSINQFLDEIETKFISKWKMRKFKPRNKKETKNP